MYSTILQFYRRYKLTYLQLDFKCPERPPSKIVNGIIILPIFNFSLKAKLPDFILVHLRLPYDCSFLQAKVSSIPAAVVTKRACTNCIWRALKIVYRSRRHLAERCSVRVMWLPRPTDIPGNCKTNGLGRAVSSEFLNSPI